MAMCLDKESHITMYADEVHPHRTHQYKNPTRDVVAEKLQGPVQRLTLRGGREHRVRVPDHASIPLQCVRQRRQMTSTKRKTQKKRLARDRSTIWGRALDNCNSSNRPSYATT